MKEEHNKVVWNAAAEDWTYEDGSDIEISDQAAFDAIKGAVDNHDFIRRIDREES